jgi:hypothetical protein
VLECTLWIRQPFYNRSTVLAGDLVHDALDTQSVQLSWGMASAVEQRLSQRVPSKI